jgi:hypothetical protein
MAEKKINYLSRNYVDVRTELLNFIKKYYPELMTDFTDASIGTMLIELNAAVADMLSYHTDRMFNETQIEYAQKRKSILNMARTLGVKVPGLRPSLTIVDFSVKVPAFGDTFDKNYAPIIRFGAQVSGAGKIFETLEDIDFNSPFTAGGIPNRSIIPNFASDGTLVNYTLTKRELVVNGKTAYFSKAINASDVKPFIQITLPENNVLTVENVITLENATSGIPTREQFTDENLKWYEVDSLAEDKVFVDDKTRISDNRSITPAKWKSVTRKFVREYTDSGFCRLTFGSGTDNGGSQLNELINNKSSFINTTALGEIPKGGTTMYVRYRVGGGSTSNVGANVINKTGSIDMDFSGPVQNLKNSVRNSLTVTNPIPALGGAESPSIEELRNLVKYNFASQNRSVTLKDYVAQLLKMPGKYGLAFRWSAEERSNKVVFNLIGLDSSGKLDNQSSSTLKQNMATWMADYRMINDYVEINDGKIVNLGIALSIFVDKTFNQSETVNNAIQKIKEYFNVKKWSMGQDIYLSDLVENINNVPGVLNVTNIEIYNLIFGNYSINRSSQELVNETANSPVTGPFDSLAPEVNRININDFVLYGEPNGMFEVKFPNRDIKVRVKTN